MRYHFTQMCGFKNAAANSVNSVVFLLASAQKKVCLTDCSFVGQIFSIDSIADHKQLHVLKQTVIAPKEWFW
jgi:hypothetical protein